jgi:hypothetical protein
MLSAVEARYLKTRDRILARRNPELLERENAEFDAMTDEELFAIAQLAPPNFDRRKAFRCSELSVPQRYVLAAALIVGVEIIEWGWGILFGSLNTFVGLLIAVLVASRFLGIGPAWFTAALATINLAYDVPMDERYFGTVAAYVAIVFVTQGSFGGLVRFLRALIKPLIQLSSRKESAPQSRSAARVIWDRDTNPLFFRNDNRI